MNALLLIAGVEVVSLSSADTATITPLPQWFSVMITILTPSLIAALKLAIPKVPSWFLPILAPLLGAIQAIVFNYAGMFAADPAMGAVLGMAGVGLREVYDQAQKRITNTQ